MTKLGVPQQSQSQQLGLTMNNVHLSNVPYEIHPMQLKVSNKCQRYFIKDHRIILHDHVQFFMPSHKSFTFVF